MAPDFQVDRQAVQQQLERMLSNPLFRNSKRYPSLLRFVVEHALDKNTENIKERTLGVEVFNREPGYDTNIDPVVRITAGEIRKRIAMYYQAPEHQHELRIELPPGSYIPEFHPPTAAEPAPPPPAPEPPPRSTWLRRHRGFVLAAASSLVLLSAGGAVAWRYFQPGPIDRFWGPVLAAEDSVLVCIGQRSYVAPAPPSVRPVTPPAEELPVGPHEPRPGATIPLFQLYYLGSQNVGLPDAITLGRLTGLLQSRGRSFSIRGETSTTFDDLRSGPVILIGAYNNDWTIRLMGPLRFRFERDKDTFWLRDSQAPSDRHLTLGYNIPHLQLKEDYALITRVIDTTTDRMVVVVGGITGYGTVAAGEFLTHPAYLESLAARAPAGWDRKNLQVVIATQVIRGVSGPPRIVATHFW